MRRFVHIGFKVIVRVDKTNETDALITFWTKIRRIEKLKLSFPKYFGNNYFFFIIPGHRILTKKDL